MTYFHLKLIAAICMVIDHVGYVFYPEDNLFRIIGRLSFPIFAWLLTQGERNTKNVNAYLTRLAIFALISQPFYWWLFDVYQLNVLVTLSLGLVTIRLAKQVPLQRYLIWAIGILVSGIIPMDGGTYGLCVILLMAEWRSPIEGADTIRWWMLWIGLHIFDQLFVGSVLQLWAIPVPLLIYFLNKQRGPKARWFYGFYPGHLAALLAIKLQVA